MADYGVICSMSRSGNVWDIAAMESFFLSLKTEWTRATSTARRGHRGPFRMRINDSPVVGFSGVRQLCWTSLPTMIYPAPPF